MGREMAKELIFVYNADSGVMSAIKGYFHKVISPKTYDCNLCSLTYDMMGMKSEWKKTIEKTGMKTVFLHKDEFKNKYKMSVDLPAIFIRNNSSIKELISSKEINDITSLQKLIRILNRRLIMHVFYRQVKRRIV